uniref:ankyrin repeat domain-containing protein 33B-like n=1 Tax=Ictidomys tridecemlineatus TaxID=43179 RepID=UPI001A9DD0F8
MQRLLERPFPEQFGKKYKLELPLTTEAVLKPVASKNCLQRLTEFVQYALTSRSGRGLEDGGVLDHMVRMTTSLYSPAVAIVCQTVCPEDPPCVGKRRLAVQEILAAKGDQDTLAQERDEAEGAEQQFRTSELVGAPERRLQDTVTCLPTCQGPRGQPLLGERPASCPCSSCAGAVCGQKWWSPGSASARCLRPTFQPECIGRKGSAKGSTHLQIPKWRYKEAKEEKKKAEEAERKHQEEAQKDKWAPRWRK